MVLLLLEKGYPLTHVVFYDSGMEFQAIYNVIEQIQRMCIEKGVAFVYLKAKTDFLMEMLIRPISSKKNGEHYGYDWCGGVCRWRTGEKIRTINEFLQTLNDGRIIQYIGIAQDEPQRVREEKGKVYPLVEWKMTEADCLAYCRKKGIKWLEDGVDLYDILDRVSCWCCKNKNLTELRAYYHYLPRYWGYLKGLQSRIDRPFYCNYTIFELEERFRREDEENEKIREYSMFGLLDNN